MGILCIFGSRTFVFHKLDVQETNLSLHSPTESEVSSSDAGLRMDGIPALDLWDLIIEVLHSSSIQSTARGSLLCDEHYEKEHSNERMKKESSTSEDLGWSNIDFVTLDAKLLVSMPCFTFSRNQDDHQWQKSDDETRISNPQSCARLAM